MPAGTSKAAKVMVYAFKTHDRIDVDESWKLAVMPGNATNRIVVSRYVAIAANPAMASVRRACPALRSIAVVDVCWFATRRTRCPRSGAD